ncbi:hypothetical protein [Roseicella aquatilis]|uniref:Uncharacterized protein n=1 Tax=Roseicella aquatilis TaxID=2527868 RepID=A0A4R4DIQ6_9PROT|nr:hypothetical protein [Roseicella aquatilis]TCZ61146.1 hypothetical protein EXY23_13535 [Roseicella aquatilis]
MPMRRALLAPVVLVAPPLLRLALGLLIILLGLAALGGLLVAAHTGAARDWAFLAGLLLAVGGLRWARLLLGRAQRALLA